MSDQTGICSDKHKFWLENVHYCYGKAQLKGNVCTCFRHVSHAFQMHPATSAEKGA